MRHRIRAVIGGLITVLLLPVFAVAPASATHDNDFGHWNQPPLVVTTAPAFWDGIIQDAAYYWQDIAFFRGYYPPLPHREDNACVNRVGRITICLANPGSAELTENGIVGIGRIVPSLYPDGSGHIQGMVIYIDATLDPVTRQRTMRHEFGHALGLGHYNKQGSGHPGQCDLMNAVACGFYASSSDAASIFTWQPNWHLQH